jgi:hypothetical protein
MLKTFDYLYLIDYETPPLLLEEKGQGVEVVYDTATGEESSYIIAIEFFWESVFQS